MPLLHVEKHGRIPDQEAQKIITFLEECYARLRPEGLDLVEIRLFENNHLWHTSLAAERRKAGVASSDFDDAFIVTHDAWTGIPRISISLERKEQLTQFVWEGALRHEVGHSILHGSLEYYVFPVPKVLMSAAEGFPKLTSLLMDIVYLLALAVKDMEVTNLLFSSGYVEDQAAYARFVMKTTEEDLQVWDLASPAAEARVLCLLGKLKDIAAAAVLASRPEKSHIALGDIEESLKYLPPGVRRALLDTVTKARNSLCEDTFTNIQTTAAILVAKVIEPMTRDPART